MLRAASALTRPFLDWMVAVTILNSARACTNSLLFLCLHYLIDNDNSAYEASICLLRIAHHRVQKLKILCSGCGCTIEVQLNILTCTCNQQYYVASNQKCPF